MNQDKVLKRSEVPLEYTWDTQSIFKDDEAFETEFKRIEDLLPSLAQHQGKLDSSVSALKKALDDRNELLMAIEHLYTYAHLRSDEDTANTHYQALQSRARSLYVKVGSTLSFFDNELLQADEATLRAFLKDDSLVLYAHEFELLFERRKHILSAVEEKLIAEAYDVFSASSQTFSVLNNADMKFKDVQDEGKTLPLSHGRYGLYLESFNRDLRQQAFKNLYASYDALKNTFASTLSFNVKLHNLNARLRHFGNARQAALFANHIPETVYDALVDAIHKRIDLLHRYVKLRKNILKLDELRMYDLYVPMVEDVEFKFTYEEARDMLLEALSVLGEDYVERLKEAFSNRWIDVLENEGKRSGAYSSGCYTTNPYILLNWQETLDNVYTLAHELGHSLHSYYSRKNQAYIYGDYSIFVAEVASTTNENLLTAYLLKKYDDPKIQATILNHYLDGVKGTVFRQTQFAEFEQFVHQADQDGTALTVDYLSENYDRINRFYYGDTMVYDDEIKLEWARIPHFYYNFYVYQYATGFSAASALSAKILREGQSAVDAYLSFLKAGSSLKPIDALKLAGVDMTTNQATIDALAVFEERLGQLEALMK